MLFISFDAILSLGINIIYSQTHYMGSFIFSKQVLSSGRKSTCIYRFNICRLACMFLLLQHNPIYMHVYSEIFDIIHSRFVITLLAIYKIPKLTYVFARCAIRL